VIARSKARSQGAKGGIETGPSSVGGGAAASRFERPPDLSETVQLRVQVGRLRGAITRLLAIIGEPAKCSHCGAHVTQLENRATGQVAVYDHTGEQHIINCRRGR